MNPQVEAQFAAALIDPDRAMPGLATWNDSDPMQRFGIYRNNRLVSLLDALAQSFPVCQMLVGEAFFRALAHEFVRSGPPVSRLIFEFGAEFPDFLASFPPASRVPYLADVARLEAARISAYHAADAPCCMPADFAALAPESFGEARVIAHPTARILRSPFAIHSIWFAHQGEMPTDFDPAGAEDVLVLRPDLTVLLHPLPQGAARFFAALHKYARLSEAAAEALAEDPAFDPDQAIALLITSGFAAKILSPTDKVPDGESR